MLLLLLACGPKDAPTAASQTETDWFPLVAGATYTYDAEFNGRQMRETREVVAVPLGDQTGFIFEVVADKDNPSGIIFANMFGLGVYGQTPEGLVTWPALHRRDADTAHTHGPAQLLVGLPPVVGEGHALDTAASERLNPIKVVGFEDLSLPAGDFKGCAHIDLGSDSAAWLCPDVGLAKWVFPTGRVEQLATYSIPGR